MALEGSLKEFGLADILQLIYFQRKIGILSLEGRMDKVRLFFYEGNVIAAESKRRLEANRLGKVLVKKGLIKEEDLRKSLEEQQATGAKLGGILIKNGLVQKEQIQDIITSQITEAITQLFTWKEGLYEFSPQGVPLDKDVPVSLDTQHLLMEGLRIIDEWSLIEGKLTLDAIFEQTGKTKAELTQDEKDVLEFVDGENDVSSIVEKIQLDNFQASKALVSLLEKNVISQKEVAPVTPAIALPEAKVKVRKKIALGQFAAMFVTATVILSSLFIAISSFLLLGNKDFNGINAYKDIAELRFRIEAYKYENGSYPMSVEQITQAADKWGRPYIYKAEDNNFILLSAGPDGKEGTGDDVY